MLLEALAAALNNNLKFAILDIRLRDKVIFEKCKDRLNYVSKNFVTRYFYLYRLSARADLSDVLFCFNSLPPVFRPICRVITYVHAPHFANLHRGSKYTFQTALRIWIERLWFKFGVKNCSELWVQTLTMAESLRCQYPQVSVRVVPFVDDDLAKKLSQINVFHSDGYIDSSRFTFFYPADAVGHKNHANLLKAWLLLKSDGFFPKLLLTLTDYELTSISTHADVEMAAVVNVNNLGPISRNEVLDIMAGCSAMIFPSLAETFGLPMLEARALKVPIVASERNFVRDVCIPVHTFDPNSPISIARAVKRFMGTAESFPPLLNASQVITSIVKRDM